MLFNSYIFLLVFLPLTVSGYCLLNARFGKWAALNFLTLASLVFYSYWNPPYTLLILGSIVVNFLLGRLLYRAAAGRKALLVAGVTANLSTLAYFKYARFGAQVFHDLTGLPVSLGRTFLPLAISFFTFTQIAYLVDVYRGMKTSYSFKEYCFFVLFFPHLIAGPIVRHYEILPQIEEAELPFRSDSLAAGLTILVIGLVKKVLLADRVAPTASTVFGLAHGGTHMHLVLAWAGSLAYTCQIYFDFSGYSDMALGLGLMFGIRLPLNFNSPYKATNIVDFWRRWHMSLSRFLRDYLYIPLGGGRVGLYRKYFNLMATMLLGGLWHGAGWTFVIWGGLHGLYLIVNHAWAALTEGMLWAESRVARAFYRVLTFTAVVAAWVWFRAASFPDSVRMLRGMFGWNGVVLPRRMAFSFPGKAPSWLKFGGAEFGVSPTQLLWIAILLAIAFLGPNTQEIMQKARPALEYNYSDGRISWSLKPAWACAAGILMALIICSLRAVSEFIYFQF
jgi:alginate O-acetyltransferase complex protein AlgI